MNDRGIRAGDSVFHAPTGETWLVASVTDDGHFYVGGWPETRARLDDVTLVTACDDEMHRTVLRGVSKTRHDDGSSSSRALWALRNLADCQGPVESEPRPEP